MSQPSLQDLDIEYVGQRTLSQVIIIDLTEPAPQCQQCSQAVREHACYFFGVCGCITCDDCFDALTRRGLCRVDDHSTYFSIQHVRRLYHDEECGICWESKQDPMLLKHCGHTFCTACLDGALNFQYSQLQEDNAEVQLSCPHCRAWIVDENDIQPLDIHDTGREAKAQLWLYQYP